MESNFNSVTYTADSVTLSDSDLYTYKLDASDIDWRITPTTYALYSQEAFTILSELREIFKGHSDTDTSINIDKELNNSIKLICTRSGKELYLTLSKSNILKCSFLYISPNHERTVLTEECTVSSLEELYNKINSFFDRIQTIDLITS